MSLMSDSRRYVTHIFTRRKPTSVLIKTGGSRELDGRDSIRIRRIYQSACGSNYVKTRAIIVTHGGELRSAAIAISRKIGRRVIPAANATDRYSNNLFDGPFSEENEKGKMVVIRREDDHRTSHGERDEFRGGPADPRGDHLLPPGGSQLTLETTVFR